MGRIQFLLIVMLLTAIFGCSSNEARRPSPEHQATYINDIFQVDKGSRTKDVDHKEFYFKKCEVETRQFAPSKTEYSCTNAPL